MAGGACNLEYKIIYYNGLNPEEVILSSVLPCIYQNLETLVFDKINFFPVCMKAKFPWVLGFESQ